MQRFEIHSHSEYSNERLTDCINKLDKLIYRAFDIGLAGIAITDHETVAGHVKANKIQKEIQKTNPNFKVALGNEIYLVDERKMGIKYYHFILIAKDAIGHRQIRELSSKAWLLGYKDRSKDYRVPTLKSEVEKMVKSNPGHLIATTACLGGELSSSILDFLSAERTKNLNGQIVANEKIVNFLNWGKNIFGDDFYIECAPGCSSDQIKANQKLFALAERFNIKMVIGSDAHYLKKEDRYIHKGYLNSKEEEREVDAFYEYSYLQTDEEVRENLSQSDFIPSIVDEMYLNSLEIYNKIENFDLFATQQIPKVQVKNYPKRELNKYWEDNYPILDDMYKSEDIYERYWVNECVNKLEVLNKTNDTYLKQLEEEARVKRVIGEKLDTNMFLYPITLQNYIDMFWEYSTVGAGRGSACAALNHYLLGVTQLDPIRWNLPFFRYMNDERTELGDIDIDIAPSKRPAILNRIKAERGKFFNADVDEVSRKNLGCTLVATFGTETSKSAIQTACRGYRSEDYPDGIDVDTAKYLSSLIPVERGFVWSINDVINGNKDKGRKPVTTFIREIEKYPGLIDIILGIEGLIKSRGSHASGVILFDEDPYKVGAFMRAPSGDITTQYDLHDAEYVSMVKYDFLVTEIQDKITQCIAFLQNNHEIESDLTLRQVYDKYLHPENISLDMLDVWNNINKGNVLNCFQFDSDIGSQAIKKIQPKNIYELSDANGLMRLMTGEPGEEQPMDKYVRFKKDLSLWYKEMDDFGLTKEEQKVLEPYFKSSYGVPPSQEQLMTMLMDENICHFTLAEANAARKIVGKKQMSKIPELKEKILKQAASEKLGKYVWRYGVSPQMGYAFSCIHSLAYSSIGYQSAVLSTLWNPIYWNTACLVVNSGSLEETSAEVVSIYEKEDTEEYTYIDLPDRKGKVKEKTTDYAKVAKAIGDITKRGIKVSLIDINSSDYGFKPDIKNNAILFGMKALNGVGSDVIDTIIEHRPYTSFKDFLNKCPIKKTAILSLIKAGAFDNLDNGFSDLPIHNRVATMIYYISLICEPKKKLTLQNFPTLVNNNLISTELDFSKKVFNFNKYLKTYKKYEDLYVFDEVCYKFYEANFDMELLEVVGGCSCIKQKTWDKLYSKQMDEVREWLKTNQEEILTKLNQLLFGVCWEKYADGSMSAWEMETLCFYYHEHELANVDKRRYGLSNFNGLKSCEVEKYFKRSGKEIPIYKLYKIAGTVIAKNDTRSSISLLTTDGVVPVKFTKEYYAMFNKQLSEKREDGTKKVLEKGWFTRGTKLMITGFRRDDTFVGKTYSSTGTHQLYKIEEIFETGGLALRHDREE